VEVKLVARKGAKEQPLRLLRPVALPGQYAEVVDRVAKRRLDGEDTCERNLHISQSFAVSSC
jgi:hypothetical protein